MTRIGGAACLFFCNAAWAGEPVTLESSSPAHVTSAPEASDEEKRSTDRAFHHEISFRARDISMPNSILDIWFYNDDEATINRPHATAYALGLEYVLKADSSNGIFYFDYFDVTMEPGYWDDRETPANHLDGSYVAATDTFGMVALGADFGHEVHIVRTSHTNGIFGLSLMPGAGLGIGIITGDLEEWRPDDTDPAYVRYENGEPADRVLPVPPVLPILDINLALRFNFADRAVFRIDGGVHTAFYYGASLGVMF